MNLRRFSCLYHYDEQGHFRAQAHLKASAGCASHYFQRQQLKKIKELENLLLKNTEQRETLMRLMALGYFDPALFNKEKNELLMQADGYRAEIDALNHTMTGDTITVSEVTSLLHYAERVAMLQAFDASAFEKYVKHIIVHSRHEIGFVMKCGLTLKERM